MHTFLGKLLVPGIACFLTVHSLIATPAVASNGVSVNGLHVSGNQILNDQQQVVRLLGVDRGASGPCIQGWSVFSGSTDEASVQAMADWDINAVRIPLNEDCWLDINRGDAPGQYFGEQYRKAIVEYVTLLGKYHIAPILDLHWSAPGTQRATDQQPMADRDHSPAFWRSVAETFKSNTSVVFDLYNEPYPDSNQDSEAAWNCLRDGGTCPGVQFTAAGMQELVTAVRSTGAKNLVMTGGVGWSGLMTHWLEYMPNDPQHNLAASTHIYKGTWCHDEACWDSVLAPIIAKYPLIVGEIGQTDCKHDYVDRVMDWLDSKGQSYTAWHWWPLNQVGCSNYPLITDYDGTPSQYGIGIREHITAAATSAAVDPLATVNFDPGAETRAASSIDVDRGTPLGAVVAACRAGTVVKSPSFSALYYCSGDGKRYVFPDAKTYATWYSDFSSVVTIPDAALASVPLGGIVRYKPGVRLVKIQSDPKVYAVGKNGTLRWVTSEQIAAQLYGSNWANQIDDIPVAFFANYSTGSAIS